MGNYTSIMLDIVKRHTRRTQKVIQQRKDTSSLYVTGLGGQYPDVIYKAADLEHVVRSLCSSHVESPG